MRKCAAAFLAGMVIILGIGVTGMAAPAAGASHASLPAVSDVGDGAVAETGSAPDQETGGAVKTVTLREASAIEPDHSAASDAGAGVERLKGAQDAKSLILAVGAGGCHVNVSYHVKQEDGTWQMLWSEAGVYGANGSGYDKREGDKKTPSGTYRFTMAFGLKANPGSLLPYHPIVAGDLWVDDSESPYYNQLVNASQVPKSWKSAENMAAEAPYYNYGLALDYNSDCVPGKGSAIFLHCSGTAADSGSAGCIRLPEHRVAELIRCADQDTRIVIAPDAEHLEYVDKAGD